MVNWASLPISLPWPFDSQTGQKRHFCHFTVFLLQFCFHPIFRSIYIYLFQSQSFIFIIIYCILIHMMSIDLIHTMSIDLIHTMSIDYVVLIDIWCYRHWCYHCWGVYIGRSKGMALYICCKNYSQIVLKIM